MTIPLLESIEDLKDKVVTTDALLTQTGIAQHILDRGGHYVMTVKDNQKHLHEAVRLHFDHLFELRPETAPDCSTVTGDETDAHRKAPKIQHGRSEFRGIWVTDQLNGYLRAEFGFPGIAQVFCIRRRVKRYRKKRLTAESGEISVGITSLSAEQADAEALLGYVRGHWTIEAVHRILDEANNWNEDRCRIRTGYGAENMTALRRLAIAIIRRHQRAVAPTLRKLRSDSRTLLDYLGLTANTRRRVAVAAQ